jgi:DNA (cytosine-5)-methyltransferase 1
MLTYLEIAQRLRPRWVVWENVPGVLSSGGGRDFGSFLGALGELGYGWAYRVLDAQWVRTHGHPHAVPQRRRRVFVVGCFGNWTAAAQVLFERESVCRDSAPRRAAREEAPADAARCFAGSSESGVAAALETTCHDYSRADGFNTVVQPVAYRWQNDRDGLVSDGTVSALRASAGASGFHEMNHPVVAQPVPYDPFQITAPVNKQNRQPGDPCHTLARDNAAHAAVAFHPLQDPISSTDGSTHCMGTGGSQGHASIAVAFTTEQTPKFQDECALTLTKQSPTGGGQPQAVAAPTITATNDPSRSPQSAESQGSRIRGVESESETLRATKRGPFTDFYTTPMTVRRLTPRECERLQGFPDDWTLIPWRGKLVDQCPDGPRYKALGNSMAVNCMEWIGQRIAAVDSSHAKR